MLLVLHLRFELSLSLTARILFIFGGSVSKYLQEKFETSPEILGIQYKNNEGILWFSSSEGYSCGNQPKQPAAQGPSDPGSSAPNQMAQGSEASSQEAQGPEQKKSSRGRPLKMSKKKAKASEGPEPSSTPGPSATQKKSARGRPSNASKKQKTQEEQDVPESAPEESRGQKRSVTDEVVTSKKQKASEEAPTRALDPTDSEDFALDNRFGAQETMDVQIKEERVYQNPAGGVLDCQAMREHNESFVLNGMPAKIKTEIKQEIKEEQREAVAVATWRAGMMGPAHIPQNVVKMEHLENLRAYEASKAEGSGLTSSEARTNRSTTPPTASEVLKTSGGSSLLDDEKEGDQATPKILDASGASPGTQVQDSVNHIQEPEKSAVKNTTSPKCFLDPKVSPRRPSEESSSLDQKLEAPYQESPVGLSTKQEAPSSGSAGSLTTPQTPPVPAPAPPSTICSIQLANAVATLSLIFNSTEWQQKSNNHARFLTTVQNPSVKLEDFSDTLENVIKRIRKSKTKAFEDGSISVEMFLGVLLSALVLPMGIELMKDEVEMIQKELKKIDEQKKESIILGKPIECWHVSRTKVEEIMELLLRMTYVLRCDL